MTPDERYPAGSIGAMFPEAAAVMEGLLAERNALEVQLRDARAQNERLRQDYTTRSRTAGEWLAERDRLRAELAAERAKVQRVEALCDEYRTNCDPDTKQAQVAEIFRAALTGGEQE